MRHLTFVAAAICLSNPVLASDLTAVRGGSIRVGTYTGVVYYTEAADGYRVVATVSVEGGAPLRFVATLGEGQQVTISTPGKPGEADRELMISRDAGKLILSDPIPETALATPQ